MDNVLRGSSPYVNTAVMENFLNITEKSAKAKKILWYLLGNSIISCILLYDVLQACPLYSFWVRVFEVTLTVAFTLNALFHLYLYYQATLSLNPVVITPKQKDLLGVNDTDPYFKISTPLGSSSPVASSSGSSTPINLSAVSWLSTGSSPGMNSNLTMSAMSWEYVPNISRCATFSAKGSQDNSQLNPKSFDLSNFSNASSTGLIDNEDSLSRYLSEFEEYEKSFEQSTNASLKNCSGRFKVESPILKGCSYQLSTPSPVLKTGSTCDTPDELVNVPSALKSHHDVWGRLGVDRVVLTQWNSNLRRWISDTVLERLVREMDALDQAFQQSGLADIKMGGVGLERLKKTVQAQVTQNMPTFPLVVRFLELCSNQEYLVGRIRELAKGGCMSEFRWNGGGKLHGKDWDEHLPTDAALVMYLMATYLDTQLPPLPHNPEGQPFTSEYLVKTPNKVPPGKNTPIIEQVQINPPHFVLSVRGQKMDVGKGRNNFFHTLLLFLHQMNEKEHGMLGRVNMSPSGLNILWVIDR